MKRLLTLLAAALFLTACSIGNTDETDKFITLSVDDIIKHYETYADNYKSIEPFTTMYEQGDLFYMGDKEFKIYAPDDKVKSVTFVSDKPSQDMLDLMRNIMAMSSTNDFIEIYNDMYYWDSRSLPKYGFFESFESNSVQLIVKYDGEEFSLTAYPI